MILSPWSSITLTGMNSIYVITKVIQRRVDGSQDFHLYWSDYKEGFGIPNHELWFGNDKLNNLTTQRSYELRIDLVNSLGNPYYAKYSSFRITDESDKYRLRVGNYSGNIGLQEIGSIIFICTNFIIATTDLSFLSTKRFAIK